MKQTSKPSSLFSKSLKWTLISGLIASLVAAAYIKVEIIPNLPDPNSLVNIQLQTPLSVYSKEGLLIAKFGEKKRIPVSYEEIPKTQINAFLAAEDKDFFQHSGVDLFGLARAAGQLILTGKKKQGGSTITMQVARNFFLSKEKTYSRKIREIILSLSIEQHLSKQQILTLYLNKIYLGHRSYGIAAAAEVYYNKKLNELSLAQQAMIAGLPKAPSAFNPVTNPTRALTRRNYVLNRLLSLNYISQSDFDDAIAEPISARLHATSIELEAPYIAEMVRNKMYRLYGADIYTTGMHVYTTIDGLQQNAANHAVKNALHQYDRRHGYRGILGHLDLDQHDINAEDFKPLSNYKVIGETEPAIVIAIDKQRISVLNREQQNIDITWEDLSWAWPYINENKQGRQPRIASDILATGDIIRIRQKPDNDAFELAQVPNVTGSLVAISPHNGALTALVGGYDFYYSKFNRATQAKRQPGSGFKPILYSAALTKGYSTSTLINDAPVVFDDAGLEQQWRPENYSGKFFGPTRLREALIHSRNLVSIRILRDIGVNHVRNFATQFGFNANNLPKNLSLSLGSGSANPYQMATAYSVFANGGFRVETHFIDRIVSASAEELFRANPVSAPLSNTNPINSLVSKTTALTDTETETGLPDELTDNNTLTTAPVLAERVMSPQINFLMNSLLRDVVKRGTGRRALSLGRSDLAGKTGTTNDQRDAWFNGFNPSLVAVAWVGFDNSKPLGNRETGGRAALPIWMAFMREALKGRPDIPLAQPDGIVGLLIDPETGLKTTPANQKAIFEYFRHDNTPAESSDNESSANTINAGQQNLDELF
ncbi:peptidase [Cycloclasticus sp. 46_120_T64]|nr:peptidase [Cycloclasticus sp. 46_120_T64]